jgi:hypothetical protein
MLLAFFKRPLGWAVIGLVAMLAMWLGYRAITADARTEARLSRNQAEAARQSGADAVNTVGEAGEREAAGDALTRENNQEIRNAPGADAPVSAEAGAAGLAALCRRRAYRDEPRCVRLRERGTDTR